MVERGIVAVELLDLILGEIADAHLARGVHRAVHRLELRGEQPRERGLTVTVATEQRDAVVGIEPEVEPLEHRLGAVADRRHVERDQRRAKFVRAREIEMQARIVEQLGDRLHPGERLDSALRLLRGRGAGGVAGDIILELLAFGLLFRARRGELRLALGALALERVVAARIERQLAAIEVEDVIDDVVEEIALVADDHDRRGIRLEEILEPQHRFEIEVVRRLVEQQQVRRREQQRRERDAHPPAARKSLERLVLHRLVEAEPDQDSRGAGGRRMGVDRVEPLVDLAEPVGIVAVLAFGHQRGTLDVGGEHGLERGGIAPRRFLRDIAEPGAARHFRGSGVRLEHPGDHPYQRRLARAVAPDQPDPAARRQRGGRAVEDRASAEAHRDVGQVEHDRGALALAASEPNPLTELAGADRVGARGNGYPGWRGGDWEIFSLTFKVQYLNHCSVFLSSLEK